MQKHIYIRQNYPLYLKQSIWALRKMLPRSVSKQLSTTELEACATGCLANIWNKIDWSYELPQIITYLKTQIQWCLYQKIKQQNRNKQKTDQLDEFAGNVDPDSQLDFYFHHFSKSTQHLLKALYIRQETPEEYAKMHHIPVERVKYRHQKALKKLKKILKG